MYLGQVFFQSRAKAEMFPLWKGCTNLIKVMGLLVPQAGGSVRSVTLLTGATPGNLQKRLSGP